MLYPTMKSRQFNHNPTQRKTPPQGVLRERNTLTTASSDNLVMGQVKILKRGELLEEVKPSKEVLKDLPKKKAVNHKMMKSGSRPKVVLKEEALDLCSTRRLGPDSVMVSKEMKKMKECYAGYCFVDSPPPSLVPLPTFAIKNH